MSSETTSANETFIRDALASGLYQDRESLVADAVRLLRIEQETLGAIREGLDSIDRGEGVPLAEADARLRAKHGIPADR